MNRAYGINKSLMNRAYGINKSPKMPNSFKKEKEYTLS
jgi:hypothetical protein